MFQQKIISVGTDLKSGAIGYLNESKVKSKSTDRQKIRRKVHSRQGETHTKMQREEQDQCDQKKIANCL